MSGIRSLCAALVVVFVSQAQAQSTDPLPNSSRVYRVAGGDSLQVHIFLPPGHSSKDRVAAILTFHGGGWSTGSPEWTFGAARRFADWGLVAIAVEYRLTSARVTPLDALSDVCAAFEWTREHAAELGVSDQIAGYGVSAGGHLVACTATVGCPVDSLGHSGSGPDALLLWSPALDLSRDAWFAKQLQGKTTAEALSPARHVGAATPPTTIVHGEKDSLTPVAAVRKYCEALTKLGQPCDLHIYPGLGHLLTRNLANQESDFDPDPQARADGIAAQRAFLERQQFIPSSARH